MCCCLRMVSSSWEEMPFSYVVIYVFSLSRYDWLQAPDGARPLGKVRGGRSMAAGCGTL